MFNSSGSGSTDSKEPKLDDEADKKAVSDLLKKDEVAAMIAKNLWTIEKILIQMDSRDSKDLATLIETKLKKINCMDPNPEAKMFMESDMLNALLMIFISFQKSNTHFNKSGYGSHPFVTTFREVGIPIQKFIKMEMFLRLPARTTEDEEELNNRLKELLNE